MAMKLRIWRNNQFNVWQPNIWDAVLLLLLFTILITLAWGAKQMSTPYQLGEVLPISLAPNQLPFYALRTVLRIFIALAFSLLFTFVIGSAAARSKHCERILIPLIDILQSVPVIGFLSITVVGFIKLFPNSLLGPECAAIFVVFTSQAWNMTLGFYQSMRTVPTQLREASSMLRLSSWQRFWRVEVPFAMPSLIWNTMMSMSASWFMIVASEAITVNKQSIMLPGIGSYIATAIMHANKLAVLYAISTMLIVIILYDQLLFRPLISWSEKFKSADAKQEEGAASLLLTLLKKTKLFIFVGDAIGIFLDAIINIRFGKNSAFIKSKISQRITNTKLIYLWYGLLVIIGFIVLFLLARFIFVNISFHETLHVVLLGSFTALKIIILMLLCALIWIPVGVWIGLRPKIARMAQPIAQFTAAFPANLLYPIVVLLIVKYSLNAQIWTTPLMVLGTQWYVLFNVIAGTTALPNDLVQVNQNLGVKNWLWWRKFILPGIFPYIITGFITAAGGAWNASILTEYITWGQHTVIAPGIGAYFTQVSASGDFPRIALGLSIMSLYVLFFNRFLWRPLYNLAEKRYQLD